MAEATLVERLHMCMETPAHLSRFLVRGERPGRLVIDYLRSNYGQEGTALSHQRIDFLEAELERRGELDRVY